jgi:hypothetical protein
MTNNKQQTTIIELFLNEIGQYIDTSEITDSVIEKYILMERANIELIELEAKEIVIIRQCAEEATKNASAYSDGYKEGYKRALDYMSDAIKEKIEIKENGIATGNNISTTATITNTTYFCEVFEPAYKPSPKVATITCVPCKKCGKSLWQHTKWTNTI